jgi:hypothetical protein
MEDYPAQTAYLNLHRHLTGLSTHLRENTTDVLLEITFSHVPVYHRHRCAGRPVPA